MIYDKLNLDSLTEVFADEAKAIDFFESLLWSDGPECPHCGEIGNAYRLTSHSHGNGKRPIRKGLWKCKGCRKQFTVRIGTIFEESKLPLRKWLMAIHLMCTSKKGISSHQVARQLGITQKSAWFMCHRIREAMKLEPLASMLKGIVEADETYVGGKPRKGTGYHKRGRGTQKAPVLALVERNGMVRAMPLAAVNTENLRREVQAAVDPSAILSTDELPEYKSIGKDQAAHLVVTHSKGEYVRGNAHTNTAESYFALLKRAHYGTHHHYSRKHLRRYVVEQSFKWDHRKVSDGERMVEAVKGAEGRRLTYRQPIE